MARRQGTFRAPLGWFGALFAVLALSGTGIAAYSLIAVMNETVRLRQRDIAIRLALGAQARDIRRWVTRRTLRITLAGVVVGVSGARWLGVLLHGPERSAEGDVAWLGVMILAFGALGLVASWLPARRAETGCNWTRAAQRFPIRRPKRPLRRKAFPSAACRCSSSTGPSPSRKAMPP